MLRWSLELVQHGGRLWDPLGGRLWDYRAFPCGRAQAERVVYVLEHTDWGRAQAGAVVLGEAGEGRLRLQVIAGSAVLGGAAVGVAVGQGLAVLLL